MQVFRNILLATFFVVAGSLILSGSQAKAETESSVQDAYSYKASEGDNLSYVVRDSINQYLKSNDKKLNAAQRVYAETNIVNDMGAYWLDVNQDVQVSKAKVQEYVNSSESLDQNTQTAWQYYADKTDIQAMIDGEKTAYEQNKIAAEQKASEQAVSSESANSTESSNSSNNSSEEVKSEEQTSSENSNSEEAVNSKGLGGWFKENWSKLVLVGLIASLIYRVVSKKNTEA
jgi:hypothetical protein